MGLVLVCWVKQLSQHERVMILVVLILLLVGWAAKSWRMKNSAIGEQPVKLNESP